MSNQLVITSGAKVRNLEGVLTGTSGVVNSLPINASNGIPQLDSNGKILVSQLPNSVMEYKGTWNVATNTPYLVNGVGNQGDVYLVEGAATTGTSHDFGAGAITFYNGDQAIYSGSIWQRASGATGSVTSVGLSTNGGAITISNSPITTSGTIAFNFNGTSGQYVNGAGNLVTFPTTIAQAQRLITEVYNETGATLTKGTVVYINGGHGNLPTVTKAIATGDSTSAQTYGVIQNDITDNNNGYVVVIGSLGDLDTQAYAAGTQLYLSSTTAGAWTSTKQYAPAHLVYVGIVVRSHPTQGVVEIRIQNGFELDELHNVSAQTPSNNQGLFYNSSNSLWENKSIATALGYTPANQALVVPYTGATTDVDLGIYELQASLLKSTGIVESTLGILTSYGITLNKTGQSAGAGAGQMQMFAPTGTSSSISFQDGNSFYISRFNFDNTGNRTYTFPAASGTVALTSDLTNYVNLTTAQTIGGTKTFSDAPKMDGSLFLKIGATSSTTGYMNLGGRLNGIRFTSDGGTSNDFNLPSLTGYSFTFPNASGTLALTSDISYPVTSVFGRTGAVVATEGDYNLTQLGDVTITSPSSGQVLRYNGSGWENSTESYVGTVTSVGLSSATSGVTIGSSPITTSGTITLAIATASGSQQGLLSSTDWTTFNNKQAQLNGTGFVKASGTTISYDNSTYLTTSAAASTYVPYTGATGAVNLGAYGLTSSNLTAKSTLAYLSLWNTSGNQWLIESAASGYLYFALSGSTVAMSIDSSYKVDFYSTIGNGTYTYTLPSATGTLALTSQIPSLTGYVNTSGSPTTNYLPKFTGTSTIGNSLVYDNGTNVGIGTITPATKLQVYQSGSSVGRFGASNYTDINQDGFDTYSSGVGSTMYLNYYSGGAVNFLNGKMLLNASGNLGLGVTPSAWVGAKAVSVGLAGSYYADGLTYGWQTGMAANAYRTGAITWAYQNTGVVATRVEMSEVNPFTIFTAPSGTAGNAITFTQAMTLTAAGRLLINTPTEGTYTLDVNGTGRFSGQLYANSNISAAGFIYGRTTNGYPTTSLGYYAIKTNNFDTERGGITLQVSNATSTFIDALTINYTGAATFSSSVTATSFSVSNGSISNNGYWGMLNTAGAGSYADWALVNSGTTRIMHNPTGTLNMVFNGNVGIGTTSPYKLLTVSTGAGGTVTGQSEVLRIAGTTQTVGNKNEIGFANYANNYNASVTLGAVTTSTDGYLIQDFYIATRGSSTDIAATERMRITSGGNLGLGVTPSAWGSGWVASQVGTSALQNTGSFSQLSNNIYFDGTNYKYITTNGATRIGMNTDGEFFVGTAPSGTAGTNATMVTRLSINGSTGAATFSNNVGIGVTLSSWDASFKALQISGGFAAMGNANAGYIFGNAYFDGDNKYFSSGPSARIDIGNGIIFRVAASGTAGTTIPYVGALTLASTGAATFSSSVTATSFFESSDSRLKTLIQDNYQTKGIASITPKLYTKNGKVELGYYAQDFIGILDNAISKGSDDMLSLSYREVHTAKIYALEQEIKELKAKLN